MRPPSSIAAQVVKDRAGAARLFRVNAAVSSPGARPLSLGRAGLEAAASTVKRRRAVEAREERARRIGRRLDAGFRALAAAPPAPAPDTRIDLASRHRLERAGLGLGKIREAIDKGREEMELRDPSTPGPRVRLSVAELERRARAYSAKYGCDVAVARRAVEAGLA